MQLPGKSRFPRVWDDNGARRGFPVVKERNLFESHVTPRVDEFGVRANHDGFATKDFFQFHRSISIEFTEDVFAALEERDVDTKSGEELSKYPRHRTTTQHDQGFREAGQLLCFVAGETTGCLQPIQFFAAFIPKILDENVFALHHLREFETDVGRMNAPFSRCVSRGA